MIFDGFEYGDWYSFTATRKTNTSFNYEICNNIFTAEINLHERLLGDVVARFIENDDSNRYKLEKNIYYPVKNYLPNIKYNIEFNEQSFVDESYIRWDGNKNIIHLRLIAIPEFFVIRMYRLTFSLPKILVPALLVLRNEKRGTKYFTFQAGPVRKISDEKIRFKADLSSFS